MKTLAKLEKNWNYWFLLGISFIFFLLRLPSLFEPYWYGDEGIYQVLGMGIRSGRLLYRDIFDNKPPLLYLVYSLFNGDQFWVRSLNLVFGIFAVILFFFLSKKLFSKNNVAYFSTLIFAFLLAIPVLEGNIANAENFMMPIILLASFLTLKSSENLHGKVHNFTSRTSILLFFSGALLGIAFLFKIVAVFDFAAFFLFLVFIDSKFGLRTLKKIGNILALLKKLSLFILGFLAPVMITVIFFTYSGSFSEFIRATFFSNIGYVGYGNKFIIPQGFLILKLILLSLFSLFVLIKRDKLTSSGVFIFLWLAFSLFNAFFSQRPYTHYLLTLLPSFCLLLGFVVSNKKWQKISFLMLVIVLYLSVTSFNIYNNTFPYYQNFISVVFGNKSMTKYEGFFDKRTPIDYQLADYILQNSKSEDNIFIWGNNAQVYKLTNKLPPGKYAVAYHITSYKDGPSNTFNGLVKTKPKFIIMMPYMNSFPFSLSGYSPKITINDVTIYERLF